MSWVRLDDRFFSHRKVLSVSLPARWLYVAGLCVAAQHNTDGVLDSAALQLLAVAAVGSNAVTLYEELVKVGLWDRAASGLDGYVIHDYLEYQLSANEQREQRAATAKRQKTLRERRRNGVTNAVCNDVETATPSRPVPYLNTLTHTPAQVIPGNPRPKPGPDDDAVKAWKAVEAGAGGPQGLGVDRKPAGTQELWLDDNRAMQWARNWHTLRQAEPPYTLADCERLGRWIAAGGTGDFKTPWQMLSKAGKAPDISAWFSLALRWDPLTDPRANRPPSRVTAAAPAMPPRDYPETLAKRQADAIERGDLPEADPAVIEEQLRKMREATA